MNDGRAVRHVTRVEPISVWVRVEFEKRTLADIISGAGSEAGESPGSQPGLAAASSRATAVSAPYSVKLDPLTS